MILQKLAQAIRRQDWFQVVIEVLIVIVGIFLGLQVQAWYEDQADRSDESIYLKRLHEELADVITALENGSERRQDTSEGLEILVSALAGNNQDLELTNGHCRALFGTHVYNSSPAALPTMTELLASGRLSLLQSETLRLLISRYVLAEANAKDVIDNLRSDKLDLTRKYPEHIHISKLDNEDSFGRGININCDFDALRQNEAFINDLVGSYTRRQAYIAGIENQESILTEMHLEIDNILATTHAEEVP